MCVRQMCEAARGNQTHPDVLVNQTTRQRFLQGFIDTDAARDSDRWSVSL